MAQATTQLTITLAEDINLTQSNVQVDLSETGGSVTGFTDNNDGTYTVDVTGVTTTETAVVTISKPGYTITPSTREVVVYNGQPAVQVNFVSLTADGSL